MKKATARSLKRQLLVRLLTFQVIVLFVFGLIFMAYLVHSDEGGVLVSPKFAETAARAIDRRADGGLVLRETPKLAALRRKNPDFWFVARSDRGEVISSGSVPDSYRAIARNLDHITFADIRDTKPPFHDLAIVRRASGPAGNFTVLGKGSLFSPTYVVVFLSNLLMLPILGLLTLITVLASRLIVASAFRPLAIVIEEAERIDIDGRGVRLPAKGIPAEVVPLVEAMNGALSRIDEGYDRHERFIADAAHELRTPIAILQAKIEANPDTLRGQDLERDVTRLATLAEQMLDLQRIDRFKPAEEKVDLGQIARGVVADLAPLAIAEGSHLEVDDFGGAAVVGDSGAIERVLANLIQNAVEHGGRHIIVRISGTIVEVEDDGPGIPEAERDRVFEPFRRLRPRPNGSGLGLNLVRQVMTRHGGTVAALEASTGGTIMRLQFSAAAQG